MYQFDEGEVPTLYPAHLVFG